MEDNIKKEKKIRVLHQLERHHIMWLSNKAHFSKKSRSQLIRELIDGAIEKEIIAGGMEVRKDES